MTRIVGSEEYERLKTDAAVGNNIGGSRMDAMETRSGGMM